MPELPLLLVSVTDADEAVIALAAGADILDVKRPEEGSLGAPFPEVLRAVVARRDADAGAARPGGVRVSVALGDAPDLPGTFALAAAGAVACGAEDVKVGLRGPGGETEAIEFLRAVAAGARSASEPAGGARGLPVAHPGRAGSVQGVSVPRLIAAAYADAGDLGALDPLLLPRVAARAGAQGCLIDTLRKDGHALFDHLSAGALAGFVAGCRAAGLLCGLAGSLGISHLPLLLELGPDIIGIRGAICDGGRRGRIDPERLRALRATLRRGVGLPR